jgi:hypothetical protein
MSYASFIFTKKNGQDLFRTRPLQLVICGRKCGNINAPEADGGWSAVHWFNSMKESSIQARRKPLRR